MSSSLWPHELYSPSGSSVHGIFLARTMEWVAMPSSRGSSWLRDWTGVSCVSCIGRWVLSHWRHLRNPKESWYGIPGVFMGYWMWSIIKSLGRHLKVQILRSLQVDWKSSGVGPSVCVYKILPLLPTPRPLGMWAVSQARSHTLCLSEEESFSGSR